MRLPELISAAAARIVGGEPFGWDIFGPNAWYLDFADYQGNPFCHCIYDTKTFKVYRVELEKPSDSVAVQWTDPDYVNLHIDECKRRDVDPDFAWDDCKFINLLNESNILATVDHFSDGNYTIYES